MFLVTLLINRWLHCIFRCTRSYTFDKYRLIFLISLTRANGLVCNVFHYKWNIPWSHILLWVILWSAVLHYFWIIKQILLIKIITNVLVIKLIFTLTFLTSRGPWRSIVSLCRTVAILICVYCSFTFFWILWLKLLLSKL